MSIENQKPQENESKNIESPKTETNPEKTEAVKPEHTAEEKAADQKPEHDPKTDENSVTKDSKKPEAKAEGEEVKVELAELKKQLQEATEQVKQVETLTTTVETLTKENEKQQSTIKEYEDLLTNLVEEKIKQIPDQFKDLVPDNMTLKQQLSWLQKAEQKGLFTREEKQNPSIEVGKPMNVEVPKVDTSKMSASELMRMAYSTIRK